MAGSSTRVRSAWALAAAVVLAGATGCGILDGLGGDSGPTADPLRVAGGQAANEAAAGLAGAPAVSYTWSSDDSEEPEDRIELQVTQGGVVYGAFDQGGREIRVLSAADQTYVRSDAEFWTGHGAAEDVASRYEDRWVRVTPDYLSFDPREALLPETVGAQVQGALADSAATSAPELTSLNEVPVFQVPTSGGFVFVTEAEPHQVVRVDDPTLLPPVAGAEADPASPAVLDVQPLDAQGVAALREEVVGAVGSLDGAYSVLPRLTVEGDLDLNCDSESGSCEAAAEVSSSFAAGVEPTPVHARLQVQFTAEGLDDRDCNDTRTIEPDATATLSCSAEWELTPGVEYQIQADAYVVARALNGEELDELQGAVGEEFDAVEQALG
ncbi:hypothetical protein [Allonocardiopsis opalescens]|uniref:Lipoprotein n=1 Tax=Allonocardiopsis opalescens TaxID=1144618 RepID=A0A2T0PW94_9ACTN|nr:hypothetical protein [Allonocardiopsis opalescens]PRX95628.1 hypothetical protein CLV72_109237 [Allonocardiopsis opalescens]